MTKRKTWLIYSKGRPRIIYGRNQRSAGLGTGGTCPLENTSQGAPMQQTDIVTYSLRSKRLPVFSRVIVPPKKTVSHHAYGWYNVFLLSKKTAGVLKER